MRTLAIAALLWIVSTSTYAADFQSVDGTISGNWPQFGFVPQHTRYNPNERILSTANVHRLRLLWSAPTGHPIESSPSVVAGIVYIGSGSDTLYALNARTGRKRWSFTTAGSIDGAPAISAGLVYVGGYDILYAVDVKTGARRWAATTDYYFPVFSSPVAANGSVFVSTSRVQAFNGLTGDLLWTSNGPVYGCHAPSIAYGRVFVGCYTGLFALSPKTGAILWQQSDFTTGSVAISDGLAFAYTSKSEIVALNVRSGAVLWHIPVGPVGSTPAVAAGTVYVGADTELYALNAATGAIRWTAATNGYVDSSPAVANGVVYVGSEDHSVYAFDTRTGRQLWKYATAAQVLSSPTVVNGMLFIGSGDGNLRAFSLP